jgi:hypothetical protein
VVPIPWVRTLVGRSHWQLRTPEVRLAHCQAESLPDPQLWCQPQCRGLAQSGWGSTGLSPYLIMILSFANSRWHHGVGSVRMGPQGWLSPYSASVPTARVGPSGHQSIRLRFKSFSQGSSTSGALWPQTLWTSAICSNVQVQPPAGIIRPRLLSPSLSGGAKRTDKQIHEGVGATIPLRHLSST